MEPKQEEWELASDVVLLKEPHSSSSSTAAAAAAESASNCIAATGSLQDFEDLEQLQLIRAEGVDKQGRRIIRIVGKFLPALVVDSERLKNYVLLKLEALLRQVHQSFVIVYFHTNVQRDDNSPGLAALRRIYEAVPEEIKTSLDVVYFVHPGLRSRLVFATLGRFFLSDRLYWKLHYINRVEFLRDYIKDGQLEVPDFVFDHDEELEHNPLVDYGIAVDPLMSQLRTDRVPIYRTMML